MESKIFETFDEFNSKTKQKKKKSKQTRKDQRVGTYEISKISFSCFCDKTHILNNGYGGLAPGC